MLHSRYGYVSEFQASKSSCRTSTGTGDVGVDARSSVPNIFAYEECKMCATFRHEKQNDHRTEPFGSSGMFAKIGSNTSLKLAKLQSVLASPLGKCAAAAWLYIPLSDNWQLIRSSFSLQQISPTISVNVQIATRNVTMKRMPRKRQCFLRPIRSDQQLLYISTCY
jgi:hypothetical protein